MMYGRSGQCSAKTLRLVTGTATDQPPALIGCCALPLNPLNPSTAETVSAPIPGREYSSSANNLCYKANSS